MELIEACNENNINKVKSILDNDSNLVHYKDHCNGTALYYACYFSDIEIVKLLISYGSNINNKIDSGYTPLCGAISSGYYDIVKLLIENKVNVNTKDKDNMSPLDISIMYYYIHISKLLIDNGAIYSHITNKRVLPYINKIKSFKLGFQSLCGIIPYKHFRKYNKVLTIILCYKKDIKIIPKMVLYYILSFLFI